jgi:hypothetical protein
MLPHGHDLLLLAGADVTRSDEGLADLSLVLQSERRQATASFTLLISVTPHSLAL